MRVIICGSRTFMDYDFFCEKMSKHDITHIIHGAAKGADTFAVQYASPLNIPYTTCVADWDKFGKRAGYLRNQEMLTHSPDFVIAFIDKPLEQSRGTAMMISLAKAANLHGVIYRSN